jgi:N-acetylglucosaminyl-diphospho-decaprenol L-rhamnosyltransferase
MKLSIIIVNYNGKHYFDACLKSIAEHTSFEYEVVVVDNASTDGSAEYLRSTYPEIKLIESESNLGFAGGNNLGAKYANGEYLLLLNNDTILLNDLGPVIEFMETDDSVGILGVRMLGKDGEYRYSAGYFPEPMRLIRLSSMYRKDDGFRNGVYQKEEVTYQVDWIEGSFLLTPANLWRDLGGLDESYFMYVEDIDYAKKVTNLGKQVIYFSDISYIHFGGYGQSRIGMLYYGLRHYHIVHSSWGKRVIVNIILDVGLLVRSFVYMLRAIFDKRGIEHALLCLKALCRQH